MTRLWGQHTWDATSSKGLVWNSRRSPDRLSIMLFVNPPGPPTADEVSPVGSTLSPRRPPTSL